MTFLEQATAVGTFAGFIAAVIVIVAFARLRGT